MLKYAVFFLFIFSTRFNATAQQTHTQLQRQREAVQKQLTVLNKQLAFTGSRIKQTAKERAALQQQIATYREQVAQLDKKMAGISNNLKQTHAELSELHTRLFNLKKSYAASLTLSWKLMNQPVAQQAFFSPENVTEALQRAHYIKVLRQLQLRQVNEIRQLQTTYNSRKQELGIQQLQTGEQLQIGVAATQQLTGKEQAMHTKAVQLQQQKNRLQLLVKQTERRKNAIETRLKKMLAAVKNPVIESPVQNSGANGKEHKGTVIKPQPVLKSNNAFLAGKHSLPCPVNGRIYMHFGLSKLIDISIPNQFVTFRTAPNAPVSNVFEGEVHSISMVEETYVVLVRHGDVYTVYGNLASVQVQKGQVINSGITIGHTARGIDTEEGELEFGVYEGKKLINPEPYISCR